MRPANRFITPPNLITLARLVLAPLAIEAVYAQRFGAAFALFLIAGVSDALDGWMARRFHMTTSLGAYLDPLADKVLLIGIYLTLAGIGELPAWLPILVVARDVMIVVAILLSWLFRRPLPIRPAWASKVNTAVQITLAAVLLGARAFGFDAHGIEVVLISATAISTTGSAAVYIAQWLDHVGLARRV